MQRVWAAGVPLRAEHLCGRVDLIHSPDGVIPPTRLPVVATMHDTAALERPELHAPGIRSQQQLRLGQVRTANAVIANSHATADALGMAGIDADRITVVPWAPSPLPAPTEAATSKSPYLLAVGELTLRKDYPTMFTAFARSALREHRLVVVGPDGYGADSVHAAARDSGLGDRLVLLGRVDDQTLANLYASATALVLSSCQEGFGFPLVEAMQRSLPIVASDLPAVREVAGAAALTCSPGDIDAFAAAMQSVVGDEDIRRRLSEAGPAQGAAYTWDAAVAATIDVYQHVIGAR
jgi:glycosyltransferase involved in cell wall biosynthesis